MIRARPLWKRLLCRPLLKISRGVEIGASLIFISPVYQKLHSLWLSFTAAPVPSIKAAVLAHVYYPELWPEIVKIWHTLPAGSPLLVTTPYGIGAEIRTLGASHPLIEIYESENRGRDIAPFLTVLNAGRLDRFDAVLKIHTKKSPHLKQGNLRRRLLFTSLAGHSSNVRRILRQFCDPRVGLVGPASFFRTAEIYWMANKALVEQLCRRMAPMPPVLLGFFEGSMFWVRPKALEPLRALGLQAEDFDVEAGQLDGTLHHATERTFTLCALANGYGTRSLQGDQLLAGCGNSIFVRPCRKIISLARPIATPRFK
jgi:rhamnosyltransferase